MRHLLGIVLAGSALVAGATLAWGWPGTWAIAALPPALVLGASLAHGIDAFLGRSPLRLGFALVGSAFGTLLALVSLLFQWAATAPPRVVLAFEETVDVPAELAWPVVSEPSRWPRWDALVGEIEPIGAASAAVPGARFRTSLTFSGQVVPAEHVVRSVEPPAALLFDVVLPPGTAIGEMEEGIRLEARGPAHVVRYHLAYTAPTVSSRAVDRAVLRPAFEELGRESARNLARLLREEGGGG